jgi:hypothetical protein
LGGRLGEGENGWKRFEGPVEDGKRVSERVARGEEVREEEMIEARKRMDGVGS